MAIIFLAFTLFYVYQFTNAQVTYVGFGCQGVANYSGINLFERAKFLVSNVSSQSSTSKFYKDMNRDTHNQLYALYQCQEDKSLVNCVACIDDATSKILQVCPNSEEAIVWYVECMFRYAYHNIFSLNQTSPYYVLHNTSVSIDSNFAPIVAKNMDGVIKSITNNGSNNGSHFATIETELTSSMKLYCFAQCTPDLDGFQCQSCLRDASNRITPYSNTSFPATVFYPSCKLGYENRAIVARDSSLAPTPKQSTDDGKTKKTMPQIVLAMACVASFGLVFTIAGLWLYFCRELPEESFEHLSRPSNISGSVSRRGVDDINNIESLQFDFASIKTATSDFSWKNKLGQGGFGEVYKGKFLTGEEIAVKRLSGNSKQGASEFKNEVNLLAKLQHKNLVRLFGFCVFREEKLLIFEFLSNLSLDRYIFDPQKRESLDWEQRFRIITGVARGLLYLHEDSRLKIIHRDLKASNILLDEAMNPKIADFGLAKLFDSDQTQDITTIIAGTYGYMAPEYLLAGKFSVKSDVYSFGIIVLEIVSGEKNRLLHPEEDEGLLPRAWRLWNADATLRLVDPLLGDIYSEEEVKLCIQIGLLCIQEDVALRPRMTSVVSALNRQSITLPPPNAPHFFTSGTSSDGTSSNRALLPEKRFRNRRSQYEIDSPEDRPTMATVVLMLESHPVVLPLWPEQPAYMGHNESIQADPEGQLDSTVMLSCSVNTVSITPLEAR